MPGKKGAFVALFLLLSLSFILPAYAGVPRVMVAEEFGATW